MSGSGQQGSPPGAGDGLVEVRLDAERCIGAGNCELLAPDHFRIDDDSGVAARTGDGRVALAEARELVDRCPSGALSIDG